MKTSILKRLTLVLLLSFSSILTLQASVTFTQEETPDYGQHDDSAGIYEQLFFVTDKLLVNDAFTIDEAGTYQGTLTDMAFPNPLLKLGMAITSATRNYGSIFGTGDFLFDVEDPGTYYVNIFASSSESDEDFGGMGLLGASVSQFSGIGGNQVSAVPVPGALFLFSSALLSFSSFVRRGGKSA